MSAPTERLSREQATDSLWQRSLPLSRDRHDVLSTEAISQAAFELAESPGGLAATSVKRVAHRLGVPATRLEQYLPARDDLLDLMLDTALAEIPAMPASGPADWRSSTERMAAALREVTLRHPWLIELIGGRPPSGPNGLRFMEESLSALTACGISVVDAAQCVNAVHALVCGSVQMHVVRTAASGRPARPTADYLRAAVTDPGLTNLAELFSTPSGLGPDAAFDFGLACLLDGISVRMQLAAPAEA